MNSTQQEILDILQEECAEVIQAVSKVRRFGVDNNIMELNKELADLQCMIHLARERISEIGSFNFNTGMNLKIDRLKVYSNIFKENTSV